MQFDLRSCLCFTPLCTQGTDLPPTTGCKNLDGTDGDGWCPDALHRMRLRCVLDTVPSGPVFVLCAVCLKVLRMCSCHAVLWASRLELAALRVAQGLESTEKEGAERAEPDDEASARFAENDGNFNRCANLYHRAASLPLTLPELELDAACSRANETGEPGQAPESGQARRGCDDLLPMWRQADLLVAAAHCHRRAMSSNAADVGAADIMAESALRLFPRHADALHAKGESLMNFCLCRCFSASHVSTSGLALLDTGRPRAALRVFQRLLRLRREDPDHPTNSAAELQSVLPWLVRAHAAVLRQSAHAAAAARSAASAIQAADLSGSQGADFTGLESDAYDHYRVLRYVLFVGY